MSWSVSASGRAEKVAASIEEQISKVNLNDAGEMETVRLVGVALVQCLRTMEPNFVVRVSASGSMGFKDWGAKTGPYQQLKMEIEPIHFYPAE